MITVDESFQRELLERCQDPKARVSDFADRLLAATEPALAGILEQLARAVRDGEVLASAPFWEELLGILLLWNARSAQEHGASPREALRSSIVSLYGALGDDCEARYRLLQWLVTSGTPDDLNAFVTALCDDPPSTPQGAALPFVPLLKRDRKALGVFPKIKVCLSNPLLAAPIVDLANYIWRNKMADLHPLADDQEQLVRLLSGLTHELESLQVDPTSAAEANRDRALTAVALAVSLCDALALIGNDSALAVLSHVLNLQHRRLRVEAAAALAHFGDRQGIDVLLACASDPVTRLRALHYAEELDIENQIDETYRAPEAVAEANLVSYLAQPSVMGVPPSACELIESRTMNWPGYEEPRQCFLFRFTYRAIVDSEPVTFSNIGIAGPVAYAFQADLGNLPVEDIYAAYAGWHAEHPEITQTPVGEATGFGGAVEELVERLERGGYQRVVPVIHGRFWGDDVIAAAAERRGVVGAVVVDAETIQWVSAEGISRPIRPADAYCIYKGRRLLRQFN
jgi:hypothetical protein